jgi:hypothetical protein
MSRLRAGEWIAGAGGVALLAALFVRWYSGASAWSAFTVLDVVLALLALVPLALLLAQATRTSPSLPVTFSVLTTVGGALATLLIVYRIVNQPGPNDAVEVELGAWLGLAAAAAIALGGWRSLRAEEVPGVALPPIETLPAP